MKTHIVALSIWACAAAQAITIDSQSIDLGHISLTGEITLHRDYNWNDPTFTPFATFGTMSVSEGTGIFADALAGDILQMSTKELYAYAQPDPMIWNLGNFTLETTYAWLGPYGSNSGEYNLNGFDPHSLHPSGGYQGDFQALFAYWEFEISDVIYDLASPITLNIHFEHYDSTRNVPDNSSTLALLGMALVFLVAGHRKINESHV